MNVRIQSLLDKWKHNKILSGFFYCLGGQIDHKQRGDYFVKAYDYLNEAYKENPVDLKVLLFLIELNIQLERYDEAESLLKPLLKLKKYYKANDKTSLGLIYYLKALLDYYRGKHMFIQKSIKIFDECLESQNAGILFFLKAKIEKELFEEDKNEIKYYYEAFTRGFRSPFLYLEVYRLFCSHPSHFYHMKDMLRIVFIWAVRYELLEKEDTRLFISWILQNQNDIKLPRTYIEHIYNKWDMNESLSLLCNVYIKENKKDKESLKIYEKAIDRRLFVKEIYSAYLETAYALAIRDIPPSILQSALLKETFDKTLTAYIYSVLCTENQYKILFQIHYNKILAFGESSLRNNIKGKYYIDIYIKLFEKNPHNDQLKKVIFEHLFLYEIHIKSQWIKYIWILENEKENMATYIVGGDTLYVEGAAYKESDLTILCVGQRQQSFYSREFIKIDKLITDMPIHILLQYYEEGYKSVDLLIVLTKYFINQIQQNVDLSHISQNAQKIMMECLEASTLSHSFRKSTSAALGSLLARNNSLEKAVPYFKLLDPKNLSSSQIEDGIKSFIEKDEISLALLWAQRFGEMDIETSFTLVKKGIQLGIKSPFIMNVSYEILLEGKYDEDIEEYLITYYEGSLKDWYKLRDAVSALGKPTLRVDEKILEKGIWIRGLDEKLEVVFQDLYEKAGDLSVIQKFVLYCSYEILIHKKTVTYKTLNNLEKIFQETKNMILGSALLHLYPKLLEDIHDKEEIIAPIFHWMKKNQFIYPIVKERRDKFPYFSYIEKNVPFIHHTKRGREVNFCYKIQGFPLIKKKMYGAAFDLYAVCVSLFYNEAIEYYIEEMDEGNNHILTEVKQYHHNIMNIKENPKKLYEKLNNAVVYSESLEFEKAEEILEIIIYEDQRNNVGYLL